MHARTCYDPKVVKSAIRSLVFFILRVLALLLLTGSGVAVFRLVLTFPQESRIPFALFPLVLLDAIRFLFVPVIGFVFVASSVGDRSPHVSRPAMWRVFMTVAVFLCITAVLPGLRYAIDAAPVPQGALGLRVREQTLISFGEQTVFVSEVDGLSLRGLVIYNPNDTPALSYIPDARFDPFRERIVIPATNEEFALASASDGFLEILAPGPVLRFLADTFSGFLRLTDTLFDRGLVMYLLHIAGTVSVLVALSLVAGCGAWPLPRLSISVLLVALLPGTAIFLSETSGHPLVGTVFTQQAAPYLGSVAMILLGLAIGVPAWMGCALASRASRGKSGE